MSALTVTLDRHLWSVVEAYLTAEQIELDDLELLGGGKGRILRVTVDSPQGVKVDRIAELSRGLARLLEDEIEGAYTLEVSSPGLERKLRRPEHYRKSIGKEVKIKTNNEIDEAKSHRGTLTEVVDDSIRIEIDGGVRTIPIEDVASARTVFEWKRGAKPGKKN